MRQTVQQKFGFVPQLFEELLRTNPAVAEAYLQAGAVLQQGVLSPLEQQVVQLTVATYNACHYCTAAHGTAALRMDLSPEAVDAILEGRLPEDERLVLLVETTREVLERRGWLSDKALQQLEARGLDRAALYEIIALIGVKTITKLHQPPGAYAGRRGLPTGHRTRSLPAPGGKHNGLKAISITNL